MPPVTSLINQFETITQPDSSLDSRRVRVKRYSMPLRQSTLSFGSAPTLLTTTTTTAATNKRHSMAATLPSLKARQPPTPPAEDEGDCDTIVIDTSAHLPTRVSLPTPSESATDVSSQTSSTAAVRSPPRSRSKRVSAAKQPAIKEGPVAPASNDKQRNISGDTLVPDPTTSQTSLLKTGIDALNMTWNMGDVFGKSGPKDQDMKEMSDTGSTITIAIDEEEVDESSSEDEAEIEAKREARRAKMAQNQKKWEQRKKAAAKNATRKSSRASLLVTKATEVMTAVTSTVLGKRARDSKSTATAATGRKSLTTSDEADAEDEPDSKKARTDTSISLATANRVLRSRAPKDKKWLITGLYSGQSRSDFVDPSAEDHKPKSKRKSDTNTAANTTIEDANTAEESKVQKATKENSVLPLPMFAGARLLSNGRDFKLPFDVFSPLPAGQPKPDEWRKVNKNVFVGDAAAEWRTSKFLEQLSSTCMCSSQTGCDANCMNKYMYYECDDKNCRLTPERCGNRAFEGLKARVKKGGKFNVGVEVVSTGDRGYGVRANRTFEANQIIVEYTGEIITQEECESRMRKEYKDNECYYLMAFDQNMIIDATRGSIARFVNHSCDPNCRMEKWTVNGKPRMALFAGDQGIMTGEELTYDYNFDPYSQKNVQICRCGSDNCRGILGPKPKELPREKESKLAGAKRKIAEVLEESSNLLNGAVKKRKTDGRKALPKGWAYVEPEVKEKKKRPASLSKEKIDKPDKKSTLTPQPSKLQRMISQKSNASSKKVSIKKGTGKRNTSAGSTKRLLDDEDAEEQQGRPSTGNGAVANLKAKAGSLKKTVNRSLKGGRRMTIA